MVLKSFIFATFGASVQRLRYISLCSKGIVDVLDYYRITISADEFADWLPATSVWTDYRRVFRVEDRSSVFYYLND